MPSEFVRDTPQPWYIQYLPFIVFVIIVIIQIIYVLICMVSMATGRETQNKSALAVGVIIALVILAVLLYITFMLCKEGWNLTAWFFVVVVLICSVSLNFARTNANKHHQPEELTLRVDHRGDNLL